MSYFRCVSNGNIVFPQQLRKLNLQWAVPTYIHKEALDDPSKEQRNIQNTFPQHRSDERFFYFPHGLELDNHWITQGHHRHCCNHSPQKSSTVRNSCCILDEQGRQLWRKQFIANQAKQGKRKRNHAAKAEGFSPPGLVARSIIICQQR